VSDFAEFFARIEELPQYHLSRLHRLASTASAARIDAAADEHPRAVRPEGDASGSADYLHTVTEAMKLAYADRDTYYADPTFVQVPGEGCSKAYAEGARGADRSGARVEGAHRGRSAETRL
jgi:gamma-glutamyltranspeptidase/glutathione hydrolase